MLQKEPDWKAFSEEVNQYVEWVNKSVKELTSLVSYTKYDRSWRYLNYLQEFFSYLANDNIDLYVGRFLTLGLNLVSHHNCMNQNDLISEFQELFTVPDQKISLPDIVFMILIYQRKRLKTEKILSLIICKKHS